MNLLDKGVPGSVASAPLVAITGACGYVGRQLTRSLIAEGFRIRGLSRSHGLLAEDMRGALGLVDVDYLDRKSLNRAVKDCDIVIHLAGIAHTRKHAADEGVYRRAILDVTQAVYSAAQEQGCKKFVFASSIKVYGDTSGSGILDETSECRPTDPYGRFKRLCEEYLLQQSSGSETVATSLRFPPIYGGNTRNSLKYLFWAAAQRMPLPVASLTNKRSILSIENLTKFMRAVCGGELDERLYVLHDLHTLAVSEIYEQLWLSYHGTNIPNWMKFGLPEFLRSFISRKGPLAALFVPFCLESKYSSKFKRLMVAESAACLHNAVLNERMPQIVG